MPSKAGGGTSNSLVLRGATVLHLDPLRVSTQDIRIQGGEIVGLGPSLPERAGESVIDLSGKWVMPGLVCAHTHLYSALACGMPLLPDPPEGFADMLAKVWWRLDEALDDNGVFVSAAVGGLRALRCGVTTVVDHHASPNAIDGSLERIDKALGWLGLRRVLCYEVSDRGGEEKAAAGLAAHAALIEAEENAMRAVMVGAHANFTLSDATLKRCAALAREAGIGLHIHVAESQEDEAITGEPLIDRMERLGALLPGSIFAHCVHLTADELRRVEDAGVWVTHQPRSNMNNGVGYAPAADFGPKVALGTDGIGADMFAELQTAYFQGCEAGVGWTPADALALLTNGAQLAGPKLGVELGRIRNGAAADLVVLEPLPGPPIDTSSLAAAMIFQMCAAQVESVMVAGQWALWHGEPTADGLDDIHDLAESTARATWSRMV